MRDLQHLAHWLKVQVTKGHPVLRIGWAMVAVVVLTFGALAALMYESVRVIDRRQRLDVRGHWAIAGAAVVGLLFVFGAANPRDQLATDGRSAEPSTPPAATTPAIVAAVRPFLEVDVPLSGASVGTSTVEARGTASAGAVVVRDVSFAADQHATAGVGGAWSMIVDLRTGANELVFRIEDDRSTERRVVITYSEARPSATATPVPAPATATPVPTSGTATPVPTTLRPTPSPVARPTVAPWPDDFRVFVCAGVRNIDDAGTHLGEAGAAAGDFDMTRVSEESEQAATDASEARDSLAHATGWKPGAAAVGALAEAAQQTILAANLLKVGAEALDADLITGAVAALEVAFDLELVAAAELVDLELETGFSCFK